MKYLLFFLALVWQMMRAYTLKILQNLAKSDKPLEDKEIIAWVNEKVELDFAVNCKLLFFVYEKLNSDKKSLLFSSSAGRCRQELKNQQF